MKLNESKGNMYDFITHTGNAIKGECPHGCTYCYMGKWGKQPPPRLDESELKGDIGSGKFIFIGSSCDMFAEAIPDEWIRKVRNYLIKYDNRYLFQSKNPGAFHDWTLPPESVYCTTIETNRWYSDIMMNSPKPQERANYMSVLYTKKYVTIEPIMNFDMNEMIFLIERCNPDQVNIGADSMGKKLPEPQKEKILELITELETFTKVKQKSNLKRLIK